jgi:translocation and assembly module TamA
MLLAACAAPAAARAADPVKYTVTIAPTGEGGLDDAVKSASTLVSLRESAPVGPFALVGRAREDAQRFLTALHSFGYYRGTVSITIDGHPLDDPRLPDTLDAAPANAEVPVAVTLALGPLFHLGRIVLEGSVPPGAEAELSIHSGMPARAADVLAAGTMVQQTLRNDGYALAHVAPPVARLNESSDTLEVSFAVDAGPRVNIGAINVSGLEHLHEDYVLRRFQLRTGELFDASRLQKARDDLYATGLFTDVTVSTPDRLGPNGGIPIDIRLKEAPLHAVRLSASWSTDQGVEAGASWTRRNLFGEGEQLTLSANATGLGGTAVRAPGYNVGADYLIPDWLRRGQSLDFNVTALRELLDAYDRTAYIASTTFSRRLGENLTGTIGLVGQEEKISQFPGTQNYTLAQLPVGLTWDSTNDALNPTTGYRAAAKITPTFSFGSAGSQPFAIMQGSASTYFDFSGDGRTVLALRGFLGAIPGVSLFTVPADQRFYAGGSGSIRGYKYQSVGPKFPNGQPTGGTALDDGSIELRQRIGASWGAVVFVDAGQISDKGVPFSGDPGIGAGLGVRYYTSFGPIRLDVAVPLVHRSNSGVLQAYVSLGQAF